MLKDMAPVSRVLFLIVLVCVLMAISGAIGCAVTMLAVHQVHLTTNWSLVPAYLWYFHHDPKIYKPFIGGSGLTLMASLIALVLAFKKERTLHGDARFARELDVRRAQLRSTSGIIVGRFNSKYMIFGGSEHVLVEAPTRAGKGVGVVIPNLLTWPDSVVVLDMKRENFEASAGYRAEAGQIIYVLDPLNPSQQSHFYNPLGYFDRNDPIMVIEELQRVALALFPSVDGNPFWVAASRMGFAGIGAYLAATPHDTLSIGTILGLMCDDPKTRLPLLVEQRRLDDVNELPRLSRACLSLISDFVDCDPEVFNSIKKTITTRLSIWFNARVEYSTSKSDFQLEELRRKRISLYLAAIPADLEMLSPLYNLIFQQVIDRNTRALPEQGGGDIQVLVVLDEFRQIGRMDVIARAFSYVAGYGIRLMPVVQSRVQIISVYGAQIAKEIITNCGLEVIYAPKDKDDADHLSARLGYQTVKAESTSRQRASLSSSNNSAGSISSSDQRRALMLPQELTAMNPKMGLIFKAGMPPIYHQKIRWFADKNLMCRHSPAPALASYALPPDYIFADYGRLRDPFWEPTLQMAPARAIAEIAEELDETVNVPLKKLDPSMVAELDALKRERETFKDKQVREDSQTAQVLAWVNADYETEAL